MRSIGVLIVGPSAVVREQIGDSIRAQAGMRVAGSAADGRSGLKLVELLRPDVLMLDAQLPGFDALQTLDALLPARAVPVVMVCDGMRSEAELTLAALERGAVDYLLKHERGSPQETVFAQQLIQTIRAVVGTDVRRMLELRRRAALHRKQRSGAKGSASRSAADPAAVPAGYYSACIAIAAATGGPSVLANLLANLAPPLPPIAISLSLAPCLTAPLAKRLASLTALEVKEAVDGDELLPNRVLLAPGDKHLQVRRRAGKATAQVIEFEPVSGNRPSADVLLHSAAEAFGVGTLGVLLSGPARDGVAGCAAVKACGGYVVGQDEASSELYGTNHAAYQEGYVDRQASLEELADVLLQFTAERFAGKSST